MVGNVVGSLDDAAVERLGEAIKRNAAEPVSAGYGGPEDEDIWQEIRDRIEEAVESGSPDDALRWLEFAERLTQSPRPLGFQD